MAFILKTLEYIMLVMNIIVVIGIVTVITNYTSCIKYSIVTPMLY